MNYKYIALGGLIGFLFAVAPSCGKSGGNCSAANCAGCCDSSGTCQTQSAATCGASGAACVACGAGQQCSGGVCTGGGAGGGGGTNSCASQGKCTKPNGECGQSCSVGCCIPNDPFGSCSNAINNQLCGKNGEVCAACASGVSCTATTGGGQCGSGGGDAGVPVAGKACTTAADCAGLPNAICKTMTSSGAPYPNGFCTADCQADSDCGANAFCVGGLDSLGETPANMCWPKCQGPSDCRGPDYVCYQVSSDPNDPGACYLANLPERDGGAPAPDGVPGKACSVSTECGPPPDNNPTCFPEVTDAGQLTGYPGGYCSSLCDVQPDTICGNTGTCITFTVAQNQTVALCQAKCGTTFEQQGNCRTGYYCRGFPSDGGSLVDPSGSAGSFEPDGYCKRRCDNQISLADGGVTTIGCGTGFTCNTNGVCCNANGLCN